MTHHLAAPLLGGVGTFFATTAITAFSFLWFVVVSQKKARDYEEAAHEEYRVKWSKTLWIYLVTFYAASGYGLLYLMQYFGTGFFVKPTHDHSVVFWMRWIFMAVVGSVYIGILAYVMTPRPHGAQSFFAVLLYAMSITAIFFANIIVERSSLISLMFFSIFWFFSAVLLLFFPQNKILGRKAQKVKQIIFSEPSVWRVAFKPKNHGEHENAITIWALVYRVFFLFFIVINYLGLIVAWFLSDGSEFTHVSGLFSTTVAFLVFDVLLTTPFALLLLVLTVAGVTKKFTARMPNGRKIIESSFVMHQETAMSNK
jgi:hypothetical protein